LHVPADAEWTTLTNYLGGERAAGGKLKESGISLRVTPNDGATNSSGFTALPGGGRQKNGQFFGLNVVGYWLTTYVRTDLSKPYYMGIAMKVDPDMPELNAMVMTSSNSKEGSCSVRCIKNNWFYFV
jgi:uncharacterized protein (TIGR02145 family)